MTTAPPSSPLPSSRRPPAGGAPPRVTRGKAILVTSLLLVGAASAIAVAVANPLWLLAIPAAALLATVAGGLYLFAKARLVARRRGSVSAARAGRPEGTKR